MTTTYLVGDLIEGGLPFPDDVDVAALVRKLDEALVALGLNPLPLAPYRPDLSRLMHGPVRKLHDTSDAPTGYPLQSKGSLLPGNNGRT